jgi:(R,R)-butanediol dehydrogenase/meso-butanediol dehydrogenase/diacetyl reductase
MEGILALPQGIGKRILFFRTPGGKAMRAAVFRKLLAPLEIQSVPDPSPGDNEVVVEVCRCGICGSDLHITEDPIFGAQSGMVLGHEYSGRIAAIGRNVDRVTIGDRVAVFPVHGCGRCATCLAGVPAWCTEMRVDGGGYGQYALAEQHQLVRLPKTLSLEDGALVEPMAVSLHGVRLANPEPGARVLIIGAGPIGLAAAYWSRHMGAGRIAVTAGSTRRAELALTLGADVFVDPADASPAAVTAALGGPPDVVYECVGKPGLIQRCVEYCRPRGTIIVLGLCTHPDTFMPFQFVSKEQKLQASAFYEVRDFEMSADVLDHDAETPRAMVTDVIGLDQLPVVFDALRQRSTQCKVLVNPFG